MPYFIKSTHPELIDQFNIPLDEYPRRCINQIAEWEKMRENLLGDENLTHTRSREYASYIMEAMETNRPFKFCLLYTSSVRRAVGRKRRAVLSGSRLHAEGGKARRSEQLHL